MIIDYLPLIGSIVVPLFAGMAWIYARIDRKFDKFSSDIDKRFEKFSSDTDKRFDKQDARFDKIDQEFKEVRNKFDKIDQDLKEIRTSLNRMEGAFYSKDCCMLKDESKEKKAQ